MTIKRLHIKFPQERLPTHVHVLRERRRGVIRVTVTGQQKSATMPHFMSQNRAAVVAVPARMGLRWRIICPAGQAIAVGCKNAHAAVSGATKWVIKKAGTVSCLHTVDPFPYRCEKAFFVHGGRIGRQTVRQERRAITTTRYQGNKDKCKTDHQGSRA